MTKDYSAYRIWRTAMMRLFQAKERLDAACDSERGRVERAYEEALAAYHTVAGAR
jgi:hypothetical protein